MRVAEGKRASGVHAGERGAAVHFQIEYLAESTEEGSVILTVGVEAEHAEAAANLAREGLARVQGSIDGYQIRMGKNGPIVLLRHLYL